MKIINNSTLEFWILEVGDIFTVGEETYIKTFVIAADGKTYNAVNLENGYIEHIKSKQNVCFKKNATLTLN